MPDCESVPCADPALVGEARLAAHVGDGALVRGRLTDVDEAPLHPARVLLVHARWDPAPQRGPPFRSPPPGVRPHLVLTAIDASGTDADGHFVLREPAGLEPDERFLVAEHDGRGRALEIGARSTVELVLPETREIVVVARTAAASPTEYAYVMVHWFGPHGETRWSTSPLAPGAAAMAVDPVSRLPYSPGAGRFDAVASSTFEAEVQVPVGEVRITVHVGSAGTNHRTIAESADRADAGPIEIAVPHPHASRLALELSPGATGAASYGFFVWQHPDRPHWVELRPGAGRRYVLEDLPPGRYFVGPHTAAQPPCRRSVVLGPDAERALVVDTASCVTRARPPHD